MSRKDVVTKVWSHDFHLGFLFYVLRSNSLFHTIKNPLFVITSWSNFYSVALIAFPAKGTISWKEIHLDKGEGEGDIKTILDGQLEIGTKNQVLVIALHATRDTHSIKTTTIHRADITIIINNRMIVKIFHMREAKITGILGATI